MCRPVPCRTCHNITWAGCGRHIDQVKAAIPAETWCPGHPDQNNDTWLRRLLGR